jgi:hypothetical protein
MKFALNAIPETLINMLQVRIFSWDIMVAEDGDVGLRFFT